MADLKYTPGPWDASDMQGTWAVYDDLGNALFVENHGVEDGYPAEANLKLAAEAPAMAMVLVKIATGSTTASRMNEILSESRAILARLERAVSAACASCHQPSCGGECLG